MPAKPTKSFTGFNIVGFPPVIPVFYLLFHIIKSNSFHALLEQLVKHCNFSFFSVCKILKHPSDNKFISTLHS